jgi:hypothetical protein
MIGQGRPSNVASNRCVTDKISCCAGAPHWWAGAALSAAVLDTLSALQESRYDFGGRQKRNDGAGMEMAIGLPNQSSTRCVWRALSRTRSRYEILRRRRGDDALHGGLGETRVGNLPEAEPSGWRASTLRIAAARAMS